MPNSIRRKRILIFLLVFGTLILLGVGFIYWLIITADEREPSRVAFNQYCASCHGDQLQGTQSGPALVERHLTYGDDVESLTKSILHGVPAHQEEQFVTSAGDASNDVIDNVLAKAIALYISEHRQDFPTTRSSYANSFVPQKITTLHHQFNTELFSTLKSRPYSLAALPDGRLLVTEKVRGLSIVDTQGIQSAPIENTPQVWKQLANVQGSYITIGSMLEVVLHPDFKQNGWVYLSFAERCQLDCQSLVPQSMVKVIRGKIRDNKWVDNEVVWSVDHEHYTVVPDGVAAGRLTFDNSNHLYISIGGKSVYSDLHKLDTPYGKVHRVKDNGDIPSDNPFLQDKDSPNSTAHTVWSYGHRTIQGLEAHPLTGDIWGAEMGPRGGDEVNLIAKGGNYGWPLYTNGLDYDATPVTLGNDLGLDFRLEDTVLPVVDFTPAPALSNFSFHHGNVFTGWKDDMLLGSLKAQTLYRLRFEARQLVEQEKLVTDLGRIRDVAMGADGLVYILIEHDDNGSIIRLTPTDASH